MRRRIAVFTKSQGNPVARSIRIGAEKWPAARKSWCSISSRPAPTTSPSRPRWPRGTAPKPDAVVFTPTDPKAMAPVVAKFAAAGIPVINVNDRLAGGNVAAFVGTDDARSRAPPRGRCSRQ